MLSAETALKFTLVSNDKAIASLQHQCIRRVVDLSSKVDAADTNFL